MARIFITGSADGLGRAAAQTLLVDGHEVIIHARSAERLAAANDLIGRGASAVVGIWPTRTRHGHWRTRSTTWARSTR
jgi:NAD(P)-dependent dehydrogenase (short-subunit alcohol dehydrogenase family)